MNRLFQIKEKLKEQKLDALLVTSVPNIIYLTDFSAFSKDEREAFLLITKNKQYIFTDARYSEAVEVHVPHFKLMEITQAESLTKILQELLQKHTIKTLGFEEENLTVSEHKKFSFPPSRWEVRLVGTKNMVENLRMVKDASEIKHIEKACQIGDKTFKFILNKLKRGITEKEIAFEIELFIKRNKADISFPPIVAFGKNAAIPHHQTSNQRLELRQLVLLDFGVKVDNYCSDMTRTIFLGKASDEQRKIYNTILQAQQKAIEFISSHCHSDAERSEVEESRQRKTRSFANAQDDIVAKDVDHIAREHIIHEGYPTIPHSLGHGIGIEVHEKPSLSPRSEDILKQGVVFSIEPGIYLPAGRHGLKGSGGVRIEDLVPLEKNAPRLTTKSPRKLIQL